MPYIPERKPVVPDPQAVQEQKRAEKRRKILRLSFGILAAAMAVYGAVRLITYQTEAASSRETSRELQQAWEEAGQAAEATAEATREEVKETPVPQLPSPAPETAAPQTTAAAQADSGKLVPAAYPDNPELKMSDRFRELRKKSQYIVGWLSMEGLEEAVVRKDNTYYLDHDAMGKKNSNGAIFLDESIYLTTRPYTLILYGHNMKNGNMFGRLKKYRESSYYYKHRVIRFDSMYEEGQYAVFAVLEFNTVPGTVGWYNIWNLASDDRETRNEAIRKLEERSACGSLIDVQAEDQILLLVTCLDGDTERMMVAARRLRDGENEQHLTLKME